MSRELTTKPTTDTLPALRPGNPLATLSLPEWCASRIAAVSPLGEEVRRDGRLLPTIPAALALTPTMRRSVTERVSDLDALTRPGPEEATLEHVGKMLLVLTRGATSDMQVDARVEVYAELLADVPAWAVERAIWLWHRHNAGAPAEDYRWAPDPAVLRRVAGNELARTVRMQARDLRRLLAAVPIEPPRPRAEAEREAVDARIAANLAAIRGHVDMERASSGRPATPETERGAAEADLARMAAAVAAREAGRVAPRAEG